MKNIFFILIIFLAFHTNSISQSALRQVSNNTQSWISVNSFLKFSNKWGMAADLHYRANNIFASPNFYFARTGVTYWYDKNISFTMGYAHLWLAPTKEGFFTYSNENRIYQQLQIFSSVKKINILTRFRNEQRWQEKIDNDDKSTHTNKFTNRFRFLESFTIPIFSNQKLPSLVLSDEILLQTGKEVVNNVFDQNRFFVGLKQKINHDLSFDIGYMLLDQQKPAGNIYDQNHTFRLFFYYNHSFFKSND